MAPFIFMDAIYNHRPITVYGDGSVIRDFTYVDDIVQGIISAIDTPVGYEIVNFGRGEPMVLREFIATMEDVVQEKAQINYVAAFSGDAPKTHASVEKAHMLFNYKPQVCVKYGLEKMYEWYCNEYLLIVGDRCKSTAPAEVFLCEE